MDIRFNKPKQTNATTSLKGHLFNFISFLTEAIAFNFYKRLSHVRPKVSVVKGLDSSEIVALDSRKIDHLGDYHFTDFSGGGCPFRCQIRIADYNVPL